MVHPRNRYSTGGYAPCPKYFLRCETVRMNSLDILLDQSITHFDFDFGPKGRYITLERTRTFKLDGVWMSYMKVSNYTDNRLILFFNV